MSYSQVDCAVQYGFLLQRNIFVKALKLLFEKLHLADETAAEGGILDVTAGARRFPIAA
ncbi:hypothetical protein [Neomesorhizobium albiziae]|uniref:hypothetical protein n=1 Tax=Neomesorhizobium albiziae TaxID=335020 RepID=UPI00165F4611|nr:hypothetical protein [Mesorhizobium albiziae]